MTDVEIAARAIMIAKGGACNVTDWAERYRNPAVMEAWDAATAALAAATPLIETRVRDECAQVADSDGAEWKANGCPAQAMGAFSVAKLLRAALAAQEKEHDA